MKNLLEILSIYIDLTIQQDVAIQRLGRVLYEAASVVKQLADTDDVMTEQFIQELENAKADIDEYQRIRDREIGEP